MSPASELSLPEANTHTHKCCLCKVYKVDIFQNQCDICKVAKMGHRNWSHNHCNRSDTKLSVFTTTRTVLTELYTQVPFPSRTHTHTHTTHTHTHTHTHTLYALNVLRFLFTCCLVVVVFCLVFLSNSQYMYLIDC